MRTFITILFLISSVLQSPSAYSQQEFFLEDPEELDPGVPVVRATPPDGLSRMLERWEEQSGPNTVPEEFDSLIGSLMDAYDVPGMTLAIVRDNRIIWWRPYGLADVPLNKPWRANTIHHVFSISKTILADAMMQMYERGAIDLDQSVNYYLAQLGSPIRLESPTHPEIPITIRMLMTHTSTIIDDWDALLSHFSIGDNPMSYVE